MTYKKLRNILSIIFALALVASLLTGKITRVDAVGSHLDLTFDGNGKLATDFFGGQDIARAVAVQADGKIVIIGNSGQDFALSRYNPSGSLDTTFSGDGKVVTRVGDFSGEARAVAIQPDGKIVVAGLGIVGVNSTTQFAVVRYTASGVLDSTFNGGIVYTSFGTFSASANAIAIQPNGYIVVVGGMRGLAVGGNTFHDWAVARYSPSGLLDPLFSGDGKTIIDFNGGPFYTKEDAKAVTILADGKILIGGTGSPSSNLNFALARLNTDGSLDTTFNGTGTVTTDFGASDTLNDMKVQPDGKIVAAGNTGSSTVTHFALARYNANGTLDNSFDLDGKVQTNINPTGSDTANAVVVQADGRIVAVGTKTTGSTPRDFALARYLPNGSLDATFGQSGILFTDMSNNSDDAANAVAVQPDGKFIAVGETTNTGASHSNFVAARYIPGAGISRVDFDGDGKTDVSIFRPSNGQWWINRSSTGSTFAAQFGVSTDKIIPSDFTGDGKSDIALFRPSTGFWFILRSEDSTFYAFPFGIATDIPVVGDFDGDAKADPAVFRPSTATWYISRSSGGTTIQTFGSNGDVPAIGDYDGDGKADIAIYRPSTGQWWIQRSQTVTVFAATFGTSTDKPVQGDYTGDGKTDIAFWRPSTGFWFILRSENSSFYAVPFGTTGDLPVPGDYDGDGRFDTAVFRPSTSTWYAQRSSGTTLIQGFGSSGDRPVPNVFVP